MNQAVCDIARQAVEYLREQGSKPCFVAHADEVLRGEGKREALDNLLPLVQRFAVALQSGSYGTPTLAELNLVGILHQAIAEASKLRKQS